MLLLGDAQGMRPARVIGMLQISGQRNGATAPRTWRCCLTTDGFPQRVAELGGFRWWKNSLRAARPRPLENLHKGCSGVRGHAVVVRAARGGTRIARKMSRTKWGHSSIPSKRGQTSRRVIGACELRARDLRWADLVRRSPGFRLEPVPVC